MRQAIRGAGIEPGRPAPVRVDDGARVPVGAHRAVLVVRPRLSLASVIFRVTPRMTAREIGAPVHGRSVSSLWRAEGNTRATGPDESGRDGRATRKQNARFDAASPDQPRH